MSQFGRDPVPGIDEDQSDVRTKKKPSTAIGLKIINGPKAGHVYQATLLSAVIGRNDPPDVLVDIDLTDAEIGTPPMTSRRHARIDRSEESEATYLTDLGSTNGTWIGEMRLAPNVQSQQLTVPSPIRFANLEFETVYLDD